MARRDEHQTEDGIIEILRSEWECNIVVQINGSTNNNEFHFFFSGNGDVHIMDERGVGNENFFPPSIRVNGSNAELQLISYQTTLSGTLNLGTIKFMVEGEYINNNLFTPSIHRFNSCSTLNENNKDYYYDKNGEFTNQLTYQKECEKPTCHVYEDGTFSGSDGNIVSKLDYQKQCQTHKCETLSDGTKYGPTGTIVSDIEYQKQCVKPTCHVYGDGTFSGPDGSIISELDYQKQCQIHRCETLSDGTKYGPTGAIISDIEYQKQCFVNICKIIDNTYFGKNGNVVTQEIYNQECNKEEEKHYCEVVDEIYYDSKGNPVNQSEYQKDCQINICKIIDEDYFGADGKLTTQEEYESQCLKEELIICQLKNDIYYGPTGMIVSKLEYQKSCEKNYCTILSDGTHYNQNGNVVSKEEYIKSCGTIENPKTGFKYISYLTIILVAILGICFYLIGKKSKIYYLK